MIILLLMLALTITALSLIRNYTGGMKRVKVDAKAVAADADSETLWPLTNTEDDLVLFMIFGVDTTGYTEKDINRSDTNMIVAINNTDRTVRIISILRDTQAEIEGYRKQKINAAYALGGYELALKTFNQNYHLGITDFITIDFAEMIDLVKYIGGVDIEITEKEAEYINGNRIAPWRDPDEEYDTVSAGMVHLNGSQTLSYARIRHADNDYYRANRQQTVIEAILTKIKTMEKTQYPTMIKYFLNTVTSTYALSDLLGFVEKGALNYEVYTYILPNYDANEDLISTRDEEGEMVWVYDLDAAAEIIHAIINQ